MEQHPNIFDKIYYPKEYWEWTSESLGQSSFWPIYLFGYDGYKINENYWSCFFRAAVILITINCVWFWWCKRKGFQVVEKAIPYGLNIAAYIFRVVVISSLTAIAIGAALGVVLFLLERNWLWTFAYFGFSLFFYNLSCLTAGLLQWRESTKLQKSKL